MVWLLARCSYGEVIQYYSVLHLVVGRLIVINDAKRTCAFCKTGCVTKCRWNNLAIIMYEASVNLGVLCYVTINHVVSLFKEP